MKKLTIAVDLDDTLIHTAQFKRDLFLLFKKFGIKNALKTYENFRKKKLFEISGFAILASISATQKQKLVSAFFTLISHPKKYNFAGAEFFLKNLKKGHKLVLLTFGHRQTQLLKIKQSGFAKYFKSIFIIGQESKLQQLSKMKKIFDGKLVLIDNSPISAATARRLGIRFIKIKSGVKTPAYFKALLKKFTLYNA